MILPTGGFQWHKMSFRFTSDSDLNLFQRKIEKLISGRIGRDLLRVEISGGLSLEGHCRYEEFKNDLENKLLRLRIKGECQKLPDKLELKQLIENFEDPLIANVAAQLQQRLSIEEDQKSEQALITREALCELFRFAKKR